ncbi:DUF5686 and carboxypeptidase-like regulatory domain-containing protein [Algivirga pacifica]|uniref:DUF5686 and carboxypeptidase-like regulatory domain-containing protein n=2 Tax=Algivirga pacifica TaxID=1162670 RepID=A0ABP9DJN3_9BACT
MLYAQNKRCAGVVKDKDSGELLPFATLYLQSDKKVGTTTDMNGTFAFELPSSVTRKDSIVVTFIGYETLKLPIRRRMVNMKIALSTASEQLDEVTVVAGENPAIEVINKARALEDRQRKEGKPWETIRNTQISWSMTEFPDRYKGLLENAKKTLASTDSTIEDVPVFAAQYRTHRQSVTGGAIQDTVISEQKRGLGFDADGVFGKIIGDNGRVIDDLFASNIIVIDKGIPSPLSPFWRQYYEAYLSDVPVMLDGMECLHIAFEPFTPSTLAFEGDLWFNLQDTALVKVDMQLSTAAATNFLSGFTLEQKRVKNEVGEYQAVYTSYTQRLTNLPLVPEVKASYEIHEQIGRPILNQVATDTALKGEGELTMGKVEWKQDTFQAIETLEKKSRIGLYAQMANVGGTGYYETKYLEFGHILNVLMFNDVEGVRTAIGAINNTLADGHLYLNAYAGYGWKDKRWKYLGDVKYIFNEDRKHILGLKALEDVTPLAMVGFERNHLNFSQLQQYGKMSEKAPFYYRNIELSYTNNLHPDWMLSTYLNRRSFEEVPTVGTEQVVGPQYTSEEGSIELRWSYQDRSAYNKNFRLLRKGGQRFPEVRLGYTLGQVHNNITLETLPFQKVYFSLSHKYAPLFPWGGETSYRVQAGAVLNEVPYPYLKYHQGLSGYVATFGAHHMMNPFEFVSDYYGELFIQHLFKGTIMGKVPGLRWIHQKTGVNLMFESTIAWGGMTDKNQQYNRELFLGDDLQTGEETGVQSMDPSIPFVAVGYGINNIFKLAFIEYWHRLTYRDVNYAHQNEGIKVGLLFRL